jgi:hypothetical protein
MAYVLMSSLFMPPRITNNNNPRAKPGRIERQHSGRRRVMRSPPDRCAVFGAVRFRARRQRRLNPSESSLPGAAEPPLPLWMAAAWSAMTVGSGCSPAVARL